METIQELLRSAFAIDSIWSIVVRGLIWLVIALIIIVSVDKPDSSKSIKDLKSNLGFFLMFTLLASGLIYALFGFTTT